MPDDLHLPFADQFSLPDPTILGNGAVLPIPAEPFWQFGYGGRIPCRHDWFPPSGQWGDQQNRVTYGMRIATKDLKLAIPYILGYSRTGGPAGNLIRVLPIQDPEGFGMYATRLSIQGYEGPNGLMTLQIPSTGNVAPDGNIYDQRMAPYFDTTLAPTLPLRNDFKVAKEYRYVRLSVEFEHVLYYVADDAFINAYVVTVEKPDGTLTPIFIGERGRFTLWNFVPGIEYVALDSNTVAFTPGPGPDGKGTPPGNTTNPLPLAKGAGFVRSVGEFKCHWTGIPADGVGTLMKKWAAIAPGTGVIDLQTGRLIPGSGVINSSIFTLFVADTQIDCPVGTLLFQPAKTMIRPNAIGFRQYDIDLSLTYRPEGWLNFLWWPNGQYYKAQYTPSLIPSKINPIAPTLPPRDIYQSLDFDKLFRF